MRRLYEPPAPRNPTDETIERSIRARFDVEGHEALAAIQRAAGDAARDFAGQATSEGVRSRATEWATRAYGAAREWEGLAARGREVSAEVRAASAVVDFVDAAVARLRGRRRILTVKAPRWLTTRYCLAVAETQRQARGLTVDTGFDYELDEVRVLDLKGLVIGVDHLPPPELDTRQCEVYRALRADGVKPADAAAAARLV